MSSTSSKILVLGESGGGKTSSLRNLDPKTTGFINVDRKEPPLQGWAENYKMVLTPDGMAIDFNKSNYVEPSMVKTVKMALEAWERRPDILTIVIDTITHMITTDYIENAIGKDFKGYQQMGKNFYNVIDLVRDSSKDVIVLGHVERKFNEMGDKVVEMKAHGKMIQDLVPPSYFTTVLMAYTERKDNKTSGWFRTQSLGGDPAKSPCYFQNEEAVTALDFIEPNDIAAILVKLDNFRKGIKPAEKVANQAQTA